MNLECPYCKKNENPSDLVVRYGHFRRQSDSQVIQRFRCNICKRHFSRATDKPCMWQKKRLVNFKLSQALVSGLSIRRAAKIYNLNRKTVVRKKIFFGLQADLRLEKFNKESKLVQVIEFDELITHEHSRYKPLSVIVAVEFRTRRILAFDVVPIAYQGRLAHKARARYGNRPDQRLAGIRRVLEKLKEFVDPKAIFKTDMSPHYPDEIKKIFPEATHIVFKGKKAANAGLGELKQGFFDPIFSVNHTLAMLRANINRLFRKTWCTTKVCERLRLHIANYVIYHNTELIPSG